MPRNVIPARPPLASRSAVVRRRLLLTLLFLGAAGLHRTWDLRGYTGKGLARLSGRKRAYGYRYTEAFLSQVADTGGAESLTDALAQWTSDLWHPETGDDEDPPSLTCSVDGHRKPVYSDRLIPRGLIGRLGVILGCRALVLLHDDQGHPLLVTTAQTIDVIELAQTYIHRWPAQENVIKDSLLPLGLYTNHGFAKVAVENSEVAKRRTYLQQHFTRLKQWAQSAGTREAQASRRHERLRKGYKRRADELYRELGLYQTTLELQEVADFVLRRQIKERKAVNEAELEPIRAKEWRAYKQCNHEFHKQERYCKEQREVLRALEDLAAKERTMYELDHCKDQVMTVCKVALANLAMWTRDQYFPPSYAHATWRRLLPFFQLPGTITYDATIIRVELCPFNDRVLNRDLALLCTQVNQASPRLPDGRLLSFTIRSTRCILPAQQVARIT